MTRPMPVGACWCPQCNRPGNPAGEDDQPVSVAAQPDPWAGAA